jgi:hypothetical protein
LQVGDLKRQEPGVRSQKPEFERSAAAGVAFIRCGLTERNRKEQKGTEKNTKEQHFSPFFLRLLIEVASN